MVGKRPRISRGVDVREERNALVDRMMQANPEATRAEILEIISTKNKKETPTVAGIKVSKKVQKALETLPNQEGMDPSRVAELGNFGKGLEAEIAKFRAERNQ